MDRKLESTLGCSGESISPSFVSESRVGFFIRLVLENGGVVIFRDHDDDENAEQACKHEIDSVMTVTGESFIVFLWTT